jgi:hypothetical protein
LSNLNGNPLAIVATLSNTNQGGEDMCKKSLSYDGFLRGGIVPFLFMKGSSKKITTKG